MGRVYALVRGVKPVETGFTPKEYIEYAVSIEEGRLTRQTIVDHTD